MEVHVCKRNADHLNIMDDEELDSNEEHDDMGSGESGTNDSEDGDSLGEQDSEENASDNTATPVYGNFGWADAMSKVLNVSKPKKKKSVILAKAKKDADVFKSIAAKSNPLGFEVDGEVKKEIKLSEEEIALKRKEDRAEKLLKRQRRKEWDLAGRIVPSITEDRERERSLAKIGTRGVVQLFNSVKVQQKTIQDRLREAGPLERKREKALKSMNKSDFLDLLQRNKPAMDDVKTDPTVSIKQEEAAWNVLRDDFMPQVTMRDWDKQASSDSDDC